MKRRYIVTLFVVVLGLLLAVWKADEIKRLLAVNSMFDEGKIVHNFSHMNDAFLTTPLAANDNSNYSSSVLQENLDYLPSQDLLDHIKQRNVTAIVASKGGIIRYEDYFLGTTKDDLRISWSVAKSFLSALMGIVLEQGSIESINDPVIKYAPTLANSGYKNASIKDVLQMSSGVVFNEDYLDENSDINKMGRTLALGGKMDEFTASITESASNSGEVWRYVSIDTHVIGMVIRGATGKTISQLLQKHIIDPLGLETESYYLTDGVGVAFVLGGLNMSTRDYLRFGLMIENDGLYNGKQIVPSAWIAASTQASANTAEGEFKYGYQWWMPVDAREGEFLARGIYGQYIYIDKQRDVVIAANAADRQFKDEGVDISKIDFFRKMAAEL